MKLIIIVFCYFLIINLIAISATNTKLKLRTNFKSLFEMNKTFFKSSETILHKKFSSKITNNMSNSKDKSNKYIDNSSGTIYQGWLKYLEISDDLGDIPESFVKNKMFYLQMSENSSMNLISKDNMGYLNIPNEQYFWLELDQHSLNAYTSRNPRYRKKDNCLKISDLVPEIMTNPCKGGIEDVGNFTEGYCFMLKFLKFTKHYVWELCAETQSEKDQWMNRITKIQQKNSLNSISNQPILMGPSLLPQTTNTLSLFSNNNHISNSITHIVHGSSSSNSINSIPGQGFLSVIPGINSNPGNGLFSGIPGNGLFPGTASNGKMDLDEKMGNLQRIAEGNWESLGNWSPCSKSCGGGMQSIERRCLSQNCQGENRLSQPCNIDPCGSINNGNSNPNMNIIDPLHKNSFQECKMIEGNLNTSNGGLNDINTLNGMSNSHIVLTSNHLDIYPILAGNNFNYNSQVPQHSIILSHITDIHHLPNNNNCFKIKEDTGSNLNLCGNNGQNSNDWMKKIENYRTKCNNKILDNITSDMNNCSTPLNAEQRLNTISKQVMDEQVSTNRNKGFMLERQFQEFQNQVRDVLSKEDTYEVNLENQEKQRIQREKMQMHDLVSREETRARNLAQEMQMLKNNDNNYEIKEKAIKRKMKNMMEDIQKQINQKRSLLVDKLERMRRMHEIEQKIAAKKLIEIKKQVGSQILSMDKRGTPERCFTMKNPLEVSQYCALAYNDIDLQNECRNPKQFCYMCCDAEIGQNSKDSNNCCYNRCDMLKKQNSCTEFYDLYHINDIIILDH